jgi:3-methyladenine DNA glycosylase AlkD
VALSRQAKEIIAAFAGKPKLGDIKKRGKEIKKDHALAKELWSTGSVHPRLLATLVLDKKLLTEAYLEELATDLLAHDADERGQIGDWLLANQLMKDRKLVALLQSWQENSNPVLRRWFWYHQARLRWTGRTPPPENSAALLDTVEACLEAEDPEVQWAMNFCAGWIGVYEPNLRARCVRIGKKSGLYKDDPVAKNCTPAYLPEFIRIEVAKRA